MVVCIDQAVPFHRSASVTRPDVLWYQPTAVQAEAAVQETPLRTVCEDPDGIGTD
jgi:hypothetical protein